MNSIGERLIYLRNLKKQNRAQVMKALNIHNLGRYEENERSPSIDIIVSIANYYNVSTDWILTGKGRGPDNEEITTQNKQTTLEGFEQILNFLDNIIKAGNLSREDLVRILYELQYDMQDSGDEQIYQEFVSQYELDMLQNYRLLSERDQGKVDGIIESMVQKSDKKPEGKKEATSSSSETTRGEISAGDNSASRVIA